MKVLKLFGAEQNMITRARKLFFLCPFVLLLFVGKQAVGQEKSVRPNVLWLYVEDISPNFSCYGETIIETPNIDRLAAQGMMFTNAFTTGPVCSPSRSALISGMNQGTLGALHHRSQTTDGKAAGNFPYYESYRLPEAIQLLPELFKEAGYYTSMGGKREDVATHLGKSDYNFVWDTDIYDSNTRQGRKEGQPFFSQIQLHGGKARDAKVKNPVDPSSVHLPPYYPDDPAVRKSRAAYLNAILALDEEVGEILETLEQEGIADNTIVFFFSDHGASQLRGKQFLYDEGIRIPLIVRWPGHIKAGEVNQDLISHLDIAVSSLDVAQISTPEYVQGKSFLSDTYQPRLFISSSRDRCDETVDVIRAIRTDRFKYIRNYYSSRPHAQYNQYRDSYPEVKAMRKLYSEGKLDAVQASMFQPTRPPEELYDLSADPQEIRNLVDHPHYKGQLDDMRELHLQEMIEIKDVGLIPEPILEDLGKLYGNKYFILQQHENRELTRRIDALIRQAEAGKVDFLYKALSDSASSMRYWALTGLGNLKLRSAKVTNAMRGCLNDSSPAVRIASALALCKLDRQTEGLPTLINELSNENVLARLYAILGLEEIGEKALPAFDAIRAKVTDDYEYVRRVARRLVSRYGSVDKTSR